MIEKTNELSMAEMVRHSANAAFSYDRHCVDPVKAAEEDLLGECVGLLKKLGFNDWPEGSDGVHYVQCNYCGQSWEEGTNPVHFPRCRLAAILERCK